MSGFGCQRLVPYYLTFYDETKKTNINSKKITMTKLSSNQTKNARQVLSIGYWNSECEHAKFISNSLTGILEFQNSSWVTVRFYYP